jgi:hypothetical protein
MLPLGVVIVEVVPEFVEDELDIGIHGFAGMLEDSGLLTRSIGVSMPSTTFFRSPIQVLSCASTLPLFMGMLLMCLYGASILYEHERNKCL